MTKSACLSLVLIRSITVLSCILSMIMSAWFWRSLGIDSFGQIVLVSIGVLLEATKVIALPLVAVLWGGGKRFSSILSALIYGVLSVVSMVGGVCVMEDNLHQGQTQRNEASKAYQLILNAIEAQEKKVGGLLKLAEVDAEKGYRKRAQDTYNKLEKEQLILNNLRQSLVSSAGAEHTSMSINLLDKNLTSSWWLFALLGSLLEVTVGYLLMICTNQKIVSGRLTNRIQLHMLDEESIEVEASVEERRDLASPQVDQKRGEISPLLKRQLSSKKKNKSISYINFEERRGEISPQMETKIGELSPQLASPQKQKRQIEERRPRAEKERVKYQNVVAKIVGQEWPPIQDKVKCLAKIGSKTASEFFQQMILEGIVCKEGGRYKVCEIA